ncbi:hypothetical protein [Azospirillum aestuarii]|uniref:hypothetical protein n=1 Tax=Azospirillum aestuarii TaxID=2802052 RepID=UPI004054CDFE
MLETPARRKLSRKEKLIGFSVVIVIYAIGYLAFMSITGEATETIEDIAASMCKEQFKVIAYPGYAVVPRMRSSSASGEFYFAWPSGAGLSLGGRNTSGHCIVNPTATQITSLTVAGKQQIWRAPEER